MIFEQGLGIDGIRALVIQPSNYEWQADAACRTEDPSVFFNEAGSSSAPAKAICAQCPVAFDCLLDSLIHGDRFGTFGGLTERERREMKRYWATEQESGASPEAALAVAVVKYSDRHKNFPLAVYVGEPMETGLMVHSNQKENNHE
jgi:WhiB family redox-sensing transcriptional regulator